MINITFSDLVEVVLGEVLQYNNNIICGVSICADFVKNNNIYFCINSSKYNSNDGSLGFTNNEDSVYGLGGVKNGHDEIYRAVEKGASVIIIDDVSYYDSNLNVGYILVTDSFTALKCLATYYVQKNKVKVVAITGSTGKTTTCKAIVDSISDFMKTKRIHRIRNSVLAMCIEILQNLSLEVDCLVVEMQIDGYGQIEQFCEIVKPYIAIITNINFSHYARFKSIEDVFFEKLAIYRNLRHDGFLIINDDNDLLHTWSLKQNDSRILKISLSKKCDYTISNISTYGEYKFLLFDAKIRNITLSNIKLLTTGMGTLYAILFSLVIADIFKFPLETFKNSLIKINSPIGRFSCFDGINGSQIIIDSYNANFISMEQGIKYVSKSSRNKKILILGSMLELADKTESEHRALGRLINSMNKQFYIITVGEAAMYIIPELKNIPLNNIYCTFTYEDVIDIIHKLLIDEDTIVFMKGSGAMRLELIAPYLLSNRIF